MNIPHAAKAVETRPLQRQHFLFNLNCGASGPDFCDETHHKVIDDDDRSYTVERLLEIKADHESKSAHMGEADAAAAAAQLFAIGTLNRFSSHKTPFVLLKNTDVIGWNEWCRGRGTANPNLGGVGYDGAQVVARPYPNPA